MARARRPPPLTVRQPAVFEHFPPELAALVPPRPLPSTVIAVTDGDSIVGLSQIIEGRYETREYRLKDVFAPEIHRGTKAERARGLLAQQALAAICPVDAPFLARILQTERSGNDVLSFTRYVAELLIVRDRQVVCVNDLMVAWLNANGGPGGTGA